MLRGRVLSDFKPQYYSNNKKTPGLSVCELSAVSPATQTETIFKRLTKTQKKTLQISHILFLYVLWIISQALKFILQSHACPVMNLCYFDNCTCTLNCLLSLFGKPVFAHFRNIWTLAYSELVLRLQSRGEKVVHREKTTKILQRESEMLLKLLCNCSVL